MGLYRPARALLKLAVGIFFRRVELFHAERLPGEGPVLLASNHPNSLADAFVLAAVCPRPVRFVATSALFRWAPLAALLRGCGVIPVTRAMDAPEGGRDLAATFREVHDALQQGEAVAVFPEGITHDDPGLRRVKGGAARMALELEERYRGWLGVRLAPVGLTYSAKQLFRSDVLVNVGEGFPAADWLGPDPRAAEKALTAELERRLKELILDLPGLEEARLVEGVKALYLDTLRLGSLVVREPLPPQAEELALTRAIADAVRFFAESRPERLRAFARRLGRYRRLLERLRLDDAAVRDLAAGGPALRETALWAALGLLAAPAALFGFVHAWLPRKAVAWAVGRFARIRGDEAQTGTAKLVAGTLAFGLFYGGLAAAVYAAWGARPALAYALLLPAASLVAHGWERGLDRLGGSLRRAAVLARLKAGSSVLLRRRAELFRELAELRALYRAARFGE